MDPAELVRLIDILNPENRAGRITIITRMGPENMRVKLPHLIRAVRGAGQIVTWVTDPMHGNTMKAPCGLKTRSFDRILVILFACNTISILVLAILFIVILLIVTTSLYSVESIESHYLFVGIRGQIAYAVFLRGKDCLCSVQI